MDEFYASTHAARILPRPDTIQEAVYDALVLGIDAFRVYEDRQAGMQVRKVLRTVRILYLHRCINNHINHGQHQLAFNELSYSYTNGHWIRVLS